MDRRRWRAWSAGDHDNPIGEEPEVFRRNPELLPLRRDYSIQRYASVQESVQRTSRYLEHQRIRLQRMKHDLQQRVNQHLLGRSTSHLPQVNNASSNRKFSDSQMNEQFEEHPLGPRRHPYRSTSTLARQRELYNNVDDFLEQVSKSQPSIYSHLVNEGLLEKAEQQPKTTEGEAGAAAKIEPPPPPKPSPPRHPILTKSNIIIMSSPSSSSSSCSPSSSSAARPVLPASPLNGLIATNGHHHQQEDDSTRPPLSPSIVLSARDPITVDTGHHQMYSKIRHRYRSPMNNGSGLSSRSSESSSSSALVIEMTNGHHHSRDEKDGDGTDITFDSNGEIVSGTLTALLKRLMPSKDYFPEKSYIFTVLLNARMFTSPMDILHEIVQHCIFEQNAKGDNFWKESRSKFFHNVLKLMSEWTETFPYDFRADKMKERLKLLLELCCSSTDVSLRGYKSVLLQNVANKVSKLERYEKALSELERDGSRCVHPSDIFTGIAEKCTSPIVVAQQLTHIELERLSMIGPEEFIQAFSRECSSKDTAMFLLNQTNKGLKTARNIEHYVDWCNRLSRLIATEICRHVKKKHRVRAIEFFIDVAKECFNMGNFNSLMAVVGGMDMNAVSRLKKTWAKVDVSKLAILERQLDPSGNFLSYRSTLKAAVWRSAGATKDSERIVVPFFSLLWKDLLVSYEGCAKQLPNGHLNYAMFSQFASQMNQFLQWKQVECPFERNDTLLRYILTSPTFSDKALQLVSFEYEPPETQAEKELQKSLKSATPSSP